MLLGNDRKLRVLDDMKMNMIRCENCGRGYREQTQDGMPIEVCPYCGTVRRIEHAGKDASRVDLANNKSDGVPNSVEFDSPKSSNHY